MANKDIKIKITVDGVDKEIKSVEDLKEAVKELGQETEKTKKKVDDKDSALGLLKKRFNDALGSIKGVVKGMTTLKGALVSSGVGAFVVLLGSLVSFFRNSEEGSRKLQIALEASNIVWGTLKSLLSDIGERLFNFFKEPKESLKAFGELIKENFINRFNGLLELIPNLSKAIGLLFKGEFKEAGQIATDALGKAFLGVEDLTEKTIEFGKAAKGVFNDFVDEVNRAVGVATKLVDAQRSLKILTNNLTVENAKLNKELREQDRISKDTTRSLEERLEALDKIDEIQIKQAENIQTQAAAQENILRLQIQEEGNYEARIALEEQLSKATAERISAETNLQTIQLRAGQLRQQLINQEINRLQSINDILEEQGLKRVDNALERTIKELEIEENKLIKELDDLKATEEQKEEIRRTFEKRRIDAVSQNQATINDIINKFNDGEIENAFRRAEKELEIEFEKNKKILEDKGATDDEILGLQEVFDNKLNAIKEDEVEFNNELEKIKKLNTLSLTADALDGVGQLIGENTKAGKAAAIATATIDTFVGAQKAYTSQLVPGDPTSAVRGVLAAASATAIGLANIKKITSTKLPGGGSVSAPAIQAPTSNFDPTASLRNEQQVNRTIGLEQIGSATAIKAFVVASDMTKQQEVDKKIENISRL